RHKLKKLGRRYYRCARAIVLSMIRDQPPVARSMALSVSAEIARSPSAMQNRTKQRCAVRAVRIYARVNDSRGSSRTRPLTEIIPQLLALKYNEMCYCFHQARRKTKINNPLDQTKHRELQYWVPGDPKKILEQIHDPDLKISPFVLQSPRRRRRLSSRERDSKLYQHLGREESQPGQKQLTNRPDPLLSLIANILYRLTSYHSISYACACVQRSVICAKAKFTNKSSAHLVVETSVDFEMLIFWLKASSNSPAHATSIMADDIVRTRKVRWVGVGLHPARPCAAASGHASAPFLAATFLLPGLWSTDSRLFYFLTCAKSKVGAAAAAAAAAAAHEKGAA
ncbi:unnamed protein product, partial [Trichogramma brassicae]